jgi:putative phosphoesterase
LNLNGICLKNKKKDQFSKKTIRGDEGVKLGIVADSHDNLGNIRKAVEILKKRGCELIIHAGDWIAPFTITEFSRLAPARIIGVFGNNDGEKDGLTKKITPLGEIRKPPFILDINGKKTIILHEPDLVDSLAKSGEFDLIIYGHTHKRTLRKEGSTLIVNPGELGGWLTGEGSLVVLDSLIFTWDIILI